MKRVSETFVPVVNSVSRLTWLLQPEGATGLFEHYIVNENGKLIRFRDFKAREHGSMCVTLLKSLVLPSNQRLKLCICTFIMVCMFGAKELVIVLPVYSHSCCFSAVHISVEHKRRLFEETSCRSFPYDVSSYDCHAPKIN